MLLCIDMCSDVVSAGAHSRRGRTPFRPGSSASRRQCGRRVRAARVRKGPHFSISRQARRVRVLKPHSVNFVLLMLQQYTAITSLHSWPHGLSGHGLSAAITVMAGTDSLLHSASGRQRCSQAQRCWKYTEATTRRICCGTIAHNHCCLRYCYACRKTGLRVGLLTLLSPTVTR